MRIWQCVDGHPVCEGCRDKLDTRCSLVMSGHTYPLEFLLYVTWSMTVVYYKVNYLPVAIRIWFWPNCRIRVFGDMANF